MRRFPGAVLFEPADLNMNGVTLPAAAVQVATPVLPWIAAWRIVGFGCRMEGSLATAGPYDLLLESRREDGTTPSFRSTLVGAFTGSPGNVVIGGTYRGFVGNPATVTGLLGGGTFGTAPHGQLFTSPYVLFAVRNNHATVAIADFSMWLTVLTE